MRSAWGLIWVCVFWATAGAYAQPASECWPDVLPADEAYLRDVAGETWACIAHFVELTTGLPYDTSEWGEYSSATNLGFYVASCAVAAEMKLIPQADATARVQRVLDAYRQFKQWHGFSQSWNHVRTLQPAPHDTMVSLLDSANLIAGLVVAGQLLPDVRADVDKLLVAMDFAPFYDAKDGRMFGGYDMARDRIGLGWHLGDYASDGRMAVFWAIAVGAAPPEAWNKLGRETESHFGLETYRPAWLGGGLFMQVQAGLFLDERCTPIGRAAANFAYAQMLYAAYLDLPAWGWSACQGPDGSYLGWGGLSVPVVTPHAAGMTAMIYPHTAAECLRRLEKLGARVPFKEAGKEQKLGFRDSVNVQTRAVCERYLPALDQAMMFLALANALEDRVVQRAFMAHPTVKRGCERIAEYSQPSDPNWLAELRRRDREPLPPVTRPKTAGPAEVLVADFENGDAVRNRVSGANTTFTRDAADTTVSLSLRIDQDATRPGKCLRVDYDMDSPNPAFGGLTFDLNKADASGCDTLVLRLRGTPAKAKFELHGRGGGGAKYVVGIKPDAWTEIAIPFIDFGGMITDWGEMHRIVIVLEDRISEPRTGTLWVDDVRLIKRNPTGK